MILVFCKLCKWFLVFEISWRWHIQFYLHSCPKCKHEVSMFFFNDIQLDIADVTNFVHPGTPLDDEASKRGTSVYLVERRIDMLPKPLTEGKWLLFVSG